MTVEQDLASIRSRLAAAQSAKARAEFQQEQAVKRQAEARASLVEEFGVESSEDIKALLVRLSEEYQTELQTIEQELEASGG